MVCGVKDKCWCFSLRRGAYISAGIILVLSIAGMGYGVYELVTGSWKIGLATVGIEGAGVLLSFLLSYGIKKEKRSVLQIWNIAGVLMAVALVVLGVCTIIDPSVGVGVGMIGAGALQVYFLAIVYAYANSVQQTVTVKA